MSDEFSLPSDNEVLKGAYLEPPPSDGSRRSRSRSRSRSSAGVKRESLSLPESKSDVVASYASEGGLDGYLFNPDRKKRTATQYSRGRTIPAHEYVRGKKKGTKREAREVGPSAWRYGSTGLSLSKFNKAFQSLSDAAKQDAARIVGRVDSAGNPRLRSGDQDRLSDTQFAQLAQIILNSVQQSAQLANDLGPDLIQYMEQLQRPLDPSDAAPTKFSRKKRSGYWAGNDVAYYVYNVSFNEDNKGRFEAKITGGHQEDDYRKAYSEGALVVPMYKKFSEQFRQNVAKHISQLEGGRQQAFIHLLNRYEVVPKHTLQKIDAQHQKVSRLLHFLRAKVYQQAYQECSSSGSAPTGEQIQRWQKSIASIPDMKGIQKALNQEYRSRHKENAGKLRDSRSRLASDPRLEPYQGRWARQNRDALAQYRGGYDRLGYGKQTARAFASPTEAPQFSSASSASER